MADKDTVPVPDFIVIGARRSGTTWLYSQLRRHPHIWVPPIKELRYFDSVDETINEGFHVQSRMFRMRHYSMDRLKHYLAVAALPFYPSLRTRVKADLSWDIRYFAGDGSLDWYRSLFMPARSRGKITGEVTPSYIYLSDEWIRAIRHLNSNIKIIVILRDPIERAWSGLTKISLQRKVKFDLASDKDVIEYFSQKDQLWRHCFGVHLKRWMVVFPREQIYVGFYDILRSNPDHFLDGITDFLGTTPVRRQPELTSRKVNPSRDRYEAPKKEVARHLASLLYPHIVELEGLVGGPAGEWRQRAEGILRA